MFWQEETNAIWYTDTKPKCDVCNRFVDRVVEMKKPNTVESDSVKACFNFRDKNNCWQRVFPAMFGDEIDDEGEEFIYMRSIEYKPLKKKQPRKATGLSKRYEVLKRDGFKCVKCGATGEESKLEIDHIVPKVQGGGDEKENLQTLCFACNRGKRDKAD